MSLFAGLVLLIALLDDGAGPEIVTWPLLLAGSGLGAMASQLGAATVSAVPDEQSGEVGGLQNTGTQLGASIGTALAGAVLISALTASFLAAVQNNPDVPANLTTQAQANLSSGSRSSPTRTSRSRSTRRTSRRRLPTPSSKPTPRRASTGCARQSRSSRSSPCSRCCSPGNLPIAQPGSVPKPNPPPDIGASPASS